MVKADLERELTSELHGVQRVPALLYCDPTASFESLNLESYEALGCEPMHDISNHIANVLEELPKHLQGQAKTTFDETWELTLGGKETKRACDHRFAIIMFAKRLKGLVTETLQTLLDTLVEMEQVLYAKDYKRCPRLILRYHNISFLHFVMCSLEFGSTPTAMSARKFYGKYIHNLVSHEPVQLRLISGQSSNAENEERIFNAIKGITNTTSSYKPSHVITNLFLRLQAEEELGSQDTTTQKQQNNITKLAASLPKFPNTKVPSCILDEHKYSRWWQAHLERISDFLLPGEGVWWVYHETSGQVEFFDSEAEQETRNEGPSLHHFRSTSFKQEEHYLSQCWNMCTQQNVKVPAHFLYLPNANGKEVRVVTNFLEEGLSNDQPLYNWNNKTQEKEDEETESQEEEGVLDVCLVQDQVPDLGCDEIQTATVSINQSSTSTPTEKGPTPVENIPSTHGSTQVQSQSTSSANSNSLPSYLNQTSSTCPIPAAYPPNHPGRDIVQTPTHVPQHAITTQLGKAVQIVLGTTEEVKKFDSARSRLKKSPTSKIAIHDYKNKLALIQTQVLAQKSMLKKNLKNWEKQFFLEHDCRMATLKEMKGNELASKLLNQLKYSDALLKEWKIKF